MKRRLFENINNEKYLKKIVSKKICLDIADKNGMTLLMFACIKKNLNSVKILLKNKVDVNAKDKEGDTALIHASMKGYNHPIIKELLLSGAKVDVYNNLMHNTALLEAASRGHVQNIKVLLQYFANINHKNKENATPLIIATVWGHLNVVKQLVAAEADLNIKDKFGMTALDSAKYDTSLSENLTASDIVKFLINLKDKKKA